MPPQSLTSCTLEGMRFTQEEIQEELDYWAWEQDEIDKYDTVTSQEERNMTERDEYTYLAMRAAEEHVNIIRALFLAQIIEGLEQNLDPDDTAGFVVETLKASLTEYKAVIK